MESCGRTRRGRRVRRAAHTEEILEVFEPTGSDRGASTAEGPSRSRRRGRDRSPEARRYQAARRRANLRLAWFSHLSVYLATLMLLSATTRSVRVVFIVGVAWGGALFIHYFWSILAPRLRERWTEEELGSQIARGVEDERRQAQSRSLRDLEDLSASIAHEIRNPITAAKSLVQQMGEDPGSSENLAFADIALAELDRVERSISHLLRYARDEEIRVGDMEMASVVRGVIDGFEDRFDEQGVRVELDIDTVGAMRGDPEMLRKAITNLVTNALDAMRDGPRDAPVLHIAQGENLAGTEVWVRVRDEGPGMEPAQAAQIFSPFYTTKDEGTGLGLALARKAIEGHGGRIELETSLGQGTEFVLILPKDGPEDAS